MQHSQNSEWACGVLIRTPTRTVLVSEDLGKQPIYKKIPGGRKRPQDETKEATAVREGYEETGVRLDESELRYVTLQQRRGHVYHLFAADVAEERLAECFEYGKNGEKVHVLAYENVRSADILPYHLEFLVEHNLLPYLVS